MSFKSILIKDASKKKKFWKQEHSLEDLGKNKFDKAPNISISSSLTKFSKKTQKLEKYTFFIIGPFFGYHKTNCEEIKYLDLTLCVLSDIKSESKPQFGFTLVRHSSNKKDFFARDSSDAEMWFHKLRRFCVQPNFSARYELLQQVGKGNFSTVHKVKSKSDNKFYAAKMIEVEGLGKSSKLRRAVRAELSIQRSLNHPNIIQFFEVFEEETKIYIITELLEGGELFERVLKRKRYSEEEAAQVIKQVLEALVYLKQKEIIHRDLKLENVILVKENDACLVKIVDFGLSTTLGSFDAQVKCGTPGYVAPEIILNKPYSCKADIFSTGVMLYILLSGCTPFPGKTFDEILARNKKCNPKFTSTYWNNVSFEAIDFIITLLSADPNKRPTPSDALEASWLTKMLANAPQRSNVNSTDISVEEYKLKQSNQLQGNSKTGKTIQDGDSLALLQALVPARRRDTPFSKKHSLTVQPDNDAFNKKFFKRHSMAPDTKESPTSMHKKIVQRNLLKKLETFDPTSVEEATDSNDQQSLYAFSHSKFNLNSGLFLNSFYEKGASQGVFSEVDVQTPKRAMMEGQENLGRRSFFGKRYSMRYEVGTNNPTSNTRVFDDENIPEEENALNGMMNSLKTMCFLSKPLFQNYDTGDSDLKRSAMSHFPDLRDSFKKRLNRPGISFIV